MTQTTAIAVLVLGFLLPIMHVALSRNSGAWSPPAGSSCPFGPRVGWLVIVVLLGPVGWLLYINSRRQRRKQLKG